MPCPNCGSTLTTLWVRSADKTFSGFTERGCLCLNPKCHLRWITQHNGNKLISIERY